MPKSELRCYWHGYLVFNQSLRSFLFVLREKRLNPAIPFRPAAVDRNSRSPKRTGPELGLIPPAAISARTGWFHLLAVIATLAVAGHAQSGTDSTKPDKSKAARPEPMVFDLVQSLGASRGETEVNTLMSFSPRTGEVNWSPEIEYAFADGYGIELELPFQDSYLDKYKVSLQGTIGTLIEERMIHGWQAIGKRVNSDKTYEADFLYLNDIRLSKNWSMMNMAGIRFRGIGKPGDSSGEAVPLVNNSVFYRFSDYFTVGCELNNENPSNGWRYRVTPQMQYIFNKHNIVQLGGGPSRLEERKKTDWLFSARVIYSF